jgi:hypothetical protein
LASAVFTFPDSRTVSALPEGVGWGRDFVDRHRKGSHIVRQPGAPQILERDSRAIKTIINDQDFQLFIHHRTSFLDHATNDPVNGPYDLAPHVPAGYLTGGDAQDQRDGCRL